MRPKSGPRASTPGVSTDSPRDVHLELAVAEPDAGQRIDRLLGRLLAPDFSRSILAMLVTDGAITVGGRRVRPSYRVSAGDVVEGDLGRAPSQGPAPEPMDLEVLHEDEALIVVAKPPGLIVHPNQGAGAGTLVNGLLARYPELRPVGRADRPGIVHRLDRDTTGVMVVARTNTAAASLVNQFKQKRVEKEYAAIVWGRMPFDSDWIDLPIGTHPRRPTLRVVDEDGRASSTFYEVAERLGPLTHVVVRPQTGRTHQIRVHLAHLGFPIVGDDAYAGRVRGAFARWKDERRDAGRRVPVLARHALHARALTITHPSTGERATFTSPLPADMADLLEVARDEDARAA